MSFFNIFSGSTPEKLEQRGDTLLESGHWGKAKLEYEHALEKLRKKPGQEKDLQRKLEGKILKAREGLAREHHQNASDLIDGGCYDEARELLTLAMGMTEDESFKYKLEEQIQVVDGKELQEKDRDRGTYFYGLEEEGDNAPEFPSQDEHFYTLCSTLPDDVRDVYAQYGEAFKAGYVALNRGDFQAAAESLTRALEEHADPDSYIPLELATAYVNMERSSEAQELLENFLEHHPEALPAYELLCDVYWEQKDFQRVDSLLASVPEEYANSIAFFILKGESFYQAKQFEAARDHYRDFLDNFGWNDAVARELGKTYEAMDEPGHARHIYKQMIDQCKSCHSCQTKLDPIIKHKYAELCFAERIHGADVLELYLSLVREIPDNASHYFDRISQIYLAQATARVRPKGKK